MTSTRLTSSYSLGRPAEEDERVRGSLNALPFPPDSTLTLLFLCGSVREEEEEDWAAGGIGSKRGRERGGVGAAGVLWE